MHGHKECIFSSSDGDGDDSKSMYTFCFFTSISLKKKLIVAPEYFDVFRAISMFRFSVHQ